MVSFRTMIAALVFFSLSAQAAEYKAPRGPGGVQPDLNGIWQALNTANYDIEMHTASHSMQLREGPHGPLPTVKTMYLGAVASMQQLLATLEPVVKVIEQRAQKRVHQDTGVPLRR